MLDAARLRALDESQHDSADSLATSRMPCGGISGPQWFVCQTHPGAERWASSNLTQRGYQTFLPLLAVKRRDRLLRTMWHIVSIPLFPSYCFIRFNAARDPWTPIWHTPGVSRLLTKDGRKPNPCPEAAISLLQATEASRRTLMAPGTLWAAGDPCRVAHGALGEHHGVVVRTTATHAFVALILFGALREVRVRLTSLAPPA